MKGESLIFAYVFALLFQLIWKRLPSTDINKMFHQLMSFSVTVGQDLCVFWVLIQDWF